MSIGLLAFGTALGAGLTYILDPARGRRRRALARDQMIRASRETGEAIETTSRDVANRTWGIVAGIRSRLGPEHVSDDVLTERVRARIGAVLGYAGSIEAEAADGRVTLTGPVLARDVARLIRRVRAVRGVRAVDNRLQVHTEPGNVPGLQGASRVPRGGERFEFMQVNWSPAARLLAGSTGAALVAWGWVRHDVVGFAATAMGSGLLIRSLSNRPLTALGGDEVRGRSTAPRGTERATPGTA